MTFDHFWDIHTAGAQLAIGLIILALAPSRALRAMLKAARGRCFRFDAAS